MKETGKFDQVEWVDDSTLQRKRSPLASVEVAGGAVPSQSAPPPTGLCHEVTVSPAKRDVRFNLPIIQAGAGKPAPRDLPKAAGRLLRILLVDDHSIIRAGLKDLLGHAFPGVTFGEAPDAEEALAQVHRHPWDLTLLDISLPGKSGLDVLAQIVNAQPNMAVLVLSMHPEEQFAARALKLGAAGYVSKSVPPAELVAAVKNALSGGRHLSPAFAQSLASRLNTKAQPVCHQVLSHREYEVLRLIGAGRTVTEIAGELCLSVKTVSTYRTRVMKKMQLRTNADIIRYALRHKLVD